MMIPSTYWNQKKGKEETKEQPKQLDKDTFTYGEGKVPQFRCTLCGSKAWYVGMIEIYCSNKKCQWYYEPHKEQEEQKE